MPSRRIHEHLDMLLFGKRYSWLHRWMDEPWRSRGKKHRQLRHDPQKTPMQAFVLSSGDWKAYISALCHIMLDKLSINPAAVELLYFIIKH
ncbi:MAG: hypothetical protein QXQ94_09780 [Candidatus Bathyarchaeia archaeon]